jgi:acetolactate synthase small subunit
MTRHSLSMLLRNEQGVLARVVVLFSSRGVEVERLSLRPAGPGELSRLDVEVTLPQGRSPAQLVEQLRRLVDVREVRHADEELELGA